jgi:hydrogenase nickel incorporation protein HypA/HybF
MHEYSLIQSLIAGVEARVRQHGAVAVHRVTVQVGELAGVEPELFRTAFELFRERTVCAGAELDLVGVPAAWACPACGSPVARGESLTCSRCGAPARLVRGEELLLERIELEVP